MSRGQLIVLILAAVVAGGSLGGLTAPASIENITQAAASRELVVFETDDCIYCRLFRRDVLPNYLKSRHADRLPIRLIDVNDAGSLEPALASPLTIVPTAVLLVDGRETGRITGYTGRAAFEQMVRHMLASH